MEELKVEMRLQTELLRELNANIAGLREDKKAEKAVSAEAVEKGMNDAMAHVHSVLKGTPLEGMMVDMIKKAGGRTPPPAA